MFPYRSLYTFYLVFLEVRVLGHWGAVILYKKVLLDQGSSPKDSNFLHCTCMFYILVCKYLTVKAFLEKDNMQKHSKNYKIVLYFYKIDFPSYIVTGP